MELDIIYHLEPQEQLRQIEKLENLITDEIKKIQVTDNWYIGKREAFNTILMIIR